MIQVEKVRNLYPFLRITNYTRTMKISKSTLETSMLNASKIIKPNVLPILENALVECSPEGIVVTASSGSVFLKQKLNDAVSENNFSFCVPPKMIADTLSSLPDQDIVLKCNDENYALTMSAIQGRYKINSENPVDFTRQEITGEPVFSIPSGNLRKMLQHTVYACSSDSLRPAMTGVLFRARGGELLAVATDGYKLVEYKYPVAIAEEFTDAVVPRSALTILLAMLPKEDQLVNVYVMNNRLIGFKFGNIELGSVLVAESFPNYEGLISDSLVYKKVAKLNRMEILSSLNRLNIFANDDKAVRFDILPEGEVKMNSNNALDFSAEERLKAECSDSEASYIGFSAKYLMEILRALEGEEVHIKYESHNNKAFIMDPASINETALIMPCMLH